MNRDSPDLSIEEFAFAKDGGGVESSFVGNNAVVWAPGLGSFSSSWSSCPPFSLVACSCGPHSRMGKRTGRCRRGLASVAERGSVASRSPIPPRSGPKLSLRHAAGRASGEGDAQADQRVRAGQDKPAVELREAGLRFARVPERSGEESVEQRVRRLAELGRLLAAAAGYRVVASDGTHLGWLDHVRYERHADHPDQVIVRRRGLFPRRRSLPFDTVEAVMPRERTIVLRLSGTTLDRSPPA